MLFSSSILLVGLLATWSTAVTATPTLQSRNNDHSAMPSDTAFTNAACSSDPLPYDHSAFSHPEFLHNLPRPQLEFLFHLQCDLGDVYPIGDGPFGNRKAITFTGGKFVGPKIKGTILSVSQRNVPYGRDQPFSRVQSAQQEARTGF